MLNSRNRPVEPPAHGPQIADWLVALSHDGPFERPYSGVALQRMSPPLTAVPRLLRLMTDTDQNVRTRAVAALGDLGGEIRRVLPLLRAALTEAALQDDDDDVRAEAVRALLRAGPQPATGVSALVDALQSDVDVVRFHAAVALGELGSVGRPAVSALMHASLWDGEPAVRVGAAQAVWKIDRRGPFALVALTEALDDANELICWIAADCLAQMGPEASDAVPALRRALKRDFRISLIKTGVILALERIDPPSTTGEI